jgi:diacylglycerol kinase (ATP)
VRVILLHNPTAGEEDHSRDRLEALLSAGGHEVVYRSVKEEHWADVLGEQADVIVIAGGDGTVRRVLTALGETPTTVTLFPVGSANNVARTLGFDSDDHARLLGGWEPAARKAYDVWEVSSDAGTTRFVEAFGGGLFGDVLAQAESEEADGEEKIELGLELVAECIAQAVPEDWELTLDGERRRERLLGLEAMNIRELGPNLPLASGADPGDRLLDVVLIRPDDRDPFMRYVAARLREEDTEPPPLSVLRQTELVVTPPATCRLHVDDKLLPSDRGGEFVVRRAAADVDVLVPALGEGNTGVSVEISA